MIEDAIEAILDAAGGGVAWDGLLVSEQNGAISIETPHTTRAELDHDEARDVLRANREYVTNWNYWSRHRGNLDSSRFAFLRWLEAAECGDVRERYDADGGIQRQWGELLVRTTIESDDGVRSHELRHRSDEGVDADSLTEYIGPGAARDIAKFDERGRYRPLKGAPTLPTGWRFSTLTATDVLAAIDFFYPASVANWFREREGALDVTHWISTAERQTGIYADLDQLDREAIDAAATACCTDSVCLRRRAWEYDADRTLDSPPGDGEFPCREACSFFIAAAKEWMELEEEPDRSFAAELTRTEAEQLESMVRSVGEGSVDDVDVADFGDPANRRRVRYVAKRVDRDEFRSPGE